MGVPRSATMETQAMDIHSIHDNGELTTETWTFTDTYILANEDVLPANKGLSPDSWEGEKSTSNREGVYRGEPMMWQREHTVEWTNDLDMR